MTTEPELTGAVVAEITNKFGDPVAFAERELTVLVDIQKLPIGTKFYTAPPSSKTQDDLAGAGVELDEAALIARFLHHTEIFHLSDTPSWLYARDGDGCSASIRTSEISGAIRNIIKELS